MSPCNDALLGGIPTTGSFCATYYMLHSLTCPVTETYTPL